ATNMGGDQVLVQTTGTSFDFSYGWRCCCHNIRMKPGPHAAKAECLVTHGEAPLVRTKLMRRVPPRARAASLSIELFQRDALRAWPEHADHDDAHDHRDRDEDCLCRHAARTEKVANGQAGECGRNAAPRIDEADCAGADARRI